MNRINFFNRVLIVWAVSVLTSLNLFYADFSSPSETEETEELPIVFENASVNKILGDDKYLGNHVAVYVEVFRTSGLDFWNFYEVRDPESDNLITVLPFSREIPAVETRLIIKAKVIVLIDIKIINYRKLGLKMVPDS